MEDILTGTTNDIDQTPETDMVVEDILGELGGVMTVTFSNGRKIDIDTSTEEGQDTIRQLQHGQ